MPRFDSPLGTKSFQSQPLREFDVPDDSGATAPRSPGNQKKQQQIEDAANINLDAIREFQSRMGTQQQAASPPPMQYQPRYAPSSDNVESISHVEQEIREMRDAQRTGKTRLNEGARRRIEMLLGMTRVTRDVVLDSGVYTLQTLKAKEMREAIFEAAKFDLTVESPYEIRRQLLARSLIQLAGVEVEQFIGARDLESKLALVDELPEPLLNRLHKEYSLLVDDAREKYSIKTEAEAKEVLEDLKK